jgi:hypothetical protein
MRRLKVREVELINEYFAAEQDEDAGSVGRTRTPEDDRAESERRREARIAIQAELDAEAIDG